MQNTTMSKKVLLEKVTKNRAQHVIEYNEAVEGYKKEAVKKIEDVSRDLKEKVEKLKEGEFIKVLGVSFDLPAPQSFEEHYNDTIDMIEDSVDDNLTLTREEYRNYVKDVWQWTGGFKALTMRYTSK